MVIIDDSLQYLENLEVDKKKVLSSGIVESMGVTYVGEKRYSIDTLLQRYCIGPDIWVFCSDTMNLQSSKDKTFSYPVFPLSVKWHLNENNCPVVSDMCINFGVERFMKMQRFSSIIFENCILYVYFVESIIEWLWG